MTKKEQYKQFAEAETLTEKDKQLITTAAQKAGIPFAPRNTRCKDCYRDMAIILYRVECEKEAKKDKTRKYLLRAGVDVLWRGVRVNATCTDEQFAAYIAKGFPRDFFLRIDED